MALEPNEIERLTKLLSECKTYLVYMHNSFPPGFYRGQLAKIIEKLRDIP